MPNGSPFCSTARPPNVTVGGSNTGSRTPSSATPRRLDRALFKQLATGKWIAEKRDLLILGPCGIGKSWLACALGQMACRQDRSVLYKRLPRLFAELEMGRGDGRYPRIFRNVTRAELLILDDWGPERLNAEQRRDLLEIIEDRHGATATLMYGPFPDGKDFLAWYR